VTGHARAVRDLDISPDGGTLTSVGLDNTLRQWSLADGSQLRMRDGYTSYMENLVFPPDGTLIAVSENDQLRLWSFPDGERVALLKIDSLFHQFSPDGRCIVSGDHPGLMQIWGIPG
jgi:WD40 repeat protein